MINHQQKYLLNILDAIKSAVNTTGDQDERTEQILIEISNLKANIEKPKNFVMKGMAKIKAYVDFEHLYFEKSLGKSSRYGNKICYGKDCS